MRKDIDLNFTVHPLSGDLATKTNTNAIKQSVRNIVLTNFYERCFNIEFGTNTNNSIFELMDPLSVQTLNGNIKKALNNFEPGIELIDVEIIPDKSSNTLFITIIYNIKNSIDTETVNIELSLL